MLRYLDECEAREWTDDDVTMLLAYLADSLGWTEHGGSVGYAWLTEHGIEARANLQRHLAASNTDA